MHAPVDPVPFEISRQGDAQIASNGLASLTLLDAGGRVFKRRGVKGVGTESPRRVEWAVVELNGVRVYSDGVNVVVTTQDLQP